MVTITIQPRSRPACQGRGSPEAGGRALYLLDVEIDYARMGDRVAELRAAEHARVAELVREGIVLVEWLKASGRGVFAVWDCPSHEALRRVIASVPMSPYLSKVLCSFPIPRLAPHYRRPFATFRLP